VALAISFATSVPAAVIGTSLVFASAAEAAILQSVQVRGNDRIDAATIRTYVSVSPGENYTQADLNTATTRLYATSLFSFVDVSGLSGIITVTVAENPIVVSVTFAGNRRAGDEDLDEVVELAPRSVFSEPASHAPGMAPATRAAK
jgi:outer membrane protein insertion porin family